MKQTTIKKIKIGETFRLENDENSPLYKRADYCRPYKQYICYMADNVSQFIMLQPDNKVFIQI